MREKCLKYTAIIIMIFLFGCSVAYGKSAVQSVIYSYRQWDEQSSLESLFSNFTNNYKNELTKTRFWINIYGGIQKLLMKKEIKNFSIISDNEGGLYSSIGKYSDETIENSFQDINKIFDKTSEVSGDFLFVQMPYKGFDAAPELNIYKKDYTNFNFDRLYTKIVAANLPSIDLRTMQTDWEYYKTDHHWTAESAFKASSYVVSYLDDTYHLSLDKNSFYKNRNNYDTKVYEDALLGSAGIQVGEYYSGKDDVKIPIPCFDTSLHWEHYIQGNKTEETTGTFWEAFINESILNSPEYYNKYNAFLNGGYCENRIYNHLAKNEKKLLLITNSYGRPFVLYLSLYFKETRYLDPQPGRFDGNYLEYIETYQPDVVVVMYNDPIIDSAE